MQALCQWEAQKDESDEALLDLLDALAEDSSAVSYAAKLTRSYWADQEAVDRLISSAAAKWDLARIGAIERNVIRVAVVEMLGSDAPPRVALSEAIDIGREYGGADSPGFINGVLDGVLHALPGSKKDEP